MAPSDWYLTCTKIGVYPPWTYLLKTWSGKSGFLADANIEDFNFKNEKSHVDKIYSFVNFSTDSQSTAMIFFLTKMGFWNFYRNKYGYLKPVLKNLIAGLFKLVEKSTKIWKL